MTKQEPTFEEQYYQIRMKEGRIWTDNELLLLPDVPKSNPHFKEWKIRKGSMEKLIAYLSAKDRPLRILDLGCGNGWMSAQIARINGSTVVGIDRVNAELTQAQRVFDGQKNLVFLDADIFEYQPDAPFDCVVMAASVQYFPDLEILVARLRVLLKQGGEIHILDSPFYGGREGVAGARARTEKYYRSMGFPGLAAHYFHHSEDEIIRLGGHIRNTALLKINLLNRLKSNANPFNWWVIKN